MIPGGVALVLVATVECVIGLSLLTRVGLRLVMYLLGIELLGILSPLVLVPGRLFSGPFHAPTLEGQYVLKDIILVAAAMVVVAANFRGARIAYKGSLPRAANGDDTGSFTAEEKLSIVLAGIHGDYTVAELCERHGILPLDYEQWRQDAVDSATTALRPPTE